MEALNVWNSHPQARARRLHTMLKKTRTALSPFEMHQRMSLKNRFDCRLTLRFSRLLDPVSIGLKIVFRFNLQGTTE